MILTVTPNPSIDLLYGAGTLVWDDANRIDEPRRRPGGQGINVTRACRAIGAQSVAVSLTGGATGTELIDVLTTEGTPLIAVAAEAPTRTFIAIEETTRGRALLLNSPGPERTAEDETRLLEAVREAVKVHRPTWVATCGSLPRGFSPDFHARVCALARETGASSVADCDGLPLRLAAEAGCDVLVPNHHEVARLLEEPVAGVESAARAARHLCDRFHVRVAAVTLGRHGAALSMAGGAWAATPPPLTGPAVGAGDAYLAALLDGLVNGLEGADLARWAVAVGAAVLLSTGLQILDPARIPTLKADSIVSPVS